MSITSTSNPDETVSATPQPMPVPSLVDLALVRDFAPEDRKALSDAGETLSIASGTTIIERDRQHDALFVVLAGAFQVIKDEAVIADVSVGQICGEMEMLNPPHSTATVRATQDSVVWRLSRDQLRGFMEARPQAGVALMKLMAHF